MILPYLNVKKRKTEQAVIAFRGVNYSDNVTAGQLEDCRNLTSERFPCLSPRAGRQAQGSYENATAVYYKNGQFVVDGSDLLYEGTVIAQVTPGKKQFASVNTKVVIMPDMILFDMDAGTCRKLTATFSTAAGAAEFSDSKTMTVHQGNYYDEVVSSGNVGGTGTTSENPPTLMRKDKFVTYTGVALDTETGEWSLTGENETIIATVHDEDDNLHINKQYVDVGTIFTKVTDVSTGAVLVDLDATKQYAVVTQQYKYQRIGVGSGSTGEPYFGFDYDVHEIKGESFEGFPGFEELGFQPGDTVEISGCVDQADNNGSRTIREIVTTEDENGNTLYQLVFDDESFPGTGTESGAVTINRKVPSLTVICESNNRLWGAEGNTIYASALGDPTNFFTYDGLDTDSYAVPVASDGEFTGCIGFGTSVLFFKEDRMYKILGDYPSQYTMYEYQVPGVEAGSEGSLQNINEVLYYKGRDGVYRYTGGSPELISEEFGLRRFSNAAAGALGERYYLSMQDEKSQKWGLWVYDIRRNIWLQEDESQCVDFAQKDGMLYFINGEGSLVLVNPEESQEAVTWSATLCRMDETYLNRKSYSKLLLRADLLENGAWMQVEISCDDRPFQRVYTSYDKRSKTLVIPILPTRCDNFRIRLSGKGKCLVRSLVREFSVGSVI